ncbi:unnamed protein product [Cuscuta campestris]|uniref:DhaK domain-containing protein n=1 Tax=Cuscuta campestris TaxID=132261 RepID=A0A484N053_9ASTE|nr:unnamed protein product [Cuscuta campestris]
MVIVEDECALPTFGVEGRRGFAGTILVHKVAGAAAASGLSLSEVAGEAKRAAKMVGTYGVALSVCTLPGQVASDRLGPGKMELCPGIRGEQGVNVADIQPADAIVSQVLKEILSPEAKNVPITRGDRVVLMVNGLGATPTMELMIAAGKAVPELQLEHGLAVDRVYTGSFMTSLDMAGFSISVMKADQAILDWLDAPTNAPYWPFRDEAQQLAALQLQVETLKSVNEDFKRVNEDFKRVNEALTGQNHYLNKLNTYHFNLAQSLERQLRSTTAHYHSQVSYRDQRISQLQNTMAEQDKQIELKSQKIMEQLLKIDEAMKWKSKYEAERALNTKEPSKDKEVLAGELMNAITAFYGEPLEKIKERLERLQKRIGDSASTDDNAPQRIDPSFYMERLKSTNAYKEMLSVFDTLYNLEVQKVEALQKVKKAQDRLFEELEVDYPLLTFVPRKGNSGASH